MRVATALALVVLLSAPGCMTCFTISKARGWPAELDSGLKSPTEEPEPLYYALVPFTAAGDLATSPLQLIAWSLSSPQPETGTDFWDPANWLWLGKYFTH